MKKTYTIGKLIGIIIIINVLISPSLYSQNYNIVGYLTLTPNIYYPNLFDVVTTAVSTDPNIVYRDPYYSSIPMEHIDANSLPTSLFLDADIVDSEITQDMRQWNKYGCKQMYYDDLKADAVPITFSDDQDLFTNGAIGFTALAVHDIGEYALLAYVSETKIKDRIT